MNRKQAVSYTCNWNGDQDTIEEQYGIMEEYTRLFPIDVACDFSDEDRKIPESDGFLQMLGYISIHPEIDTVLVSDIDRLAMHPKELIKVLGHLSKMGISVVLAEDELYDFDVLAEANQEIIWDHAVIKSFSPAYAGVPFSEILDEVECEEGF